MNLILNDWNLETLFVELPGAVDGRIGGRVVGLVGLLVVKFPPGR